MKKYIKDGMITVVALLMAFALSMIFQNIFDVQEHITTVFVFAVFLVSLLTTGYFWGIAAAFFGTIAVNYAFTFPLFALDFATPVNLISGIVMIVIAVLTSALTTKLKRHEATKAESERERMRANLLRAVSHDLRTPLTTIYGSGTTLLENDQLTQEQKTGMIKGITEDAEWLIRMVENLLSVTKIDSGKVELIKTPTVLEELIDTVALKFKKRYPDQIVTVKIPAELVVIPMDALLIQQVLFNLLENAVRHATGITKLLLDVKTQGQQAVFSVIDDGCGIPPERMANLFSGYLPEDRPTPDGKKRNAGIGLSVCATIVKAHGGKIWAENGINGGAMFCFSLDAEEISHDAE